MRVELWAKPYGIKVRCYWEHFGEPFANLMGTHRQHDGNKEKKQKKILVLLPINFIKKKPGPLMSLC
jgi:hypothetical protein